MVGVRANTFVAAIGFLLVVTSLAFGGNRQASPRGGEAGLEGQSTKFLDPIRAMTADPARGPKLGTHLDLALSRDGELFVADPDRHRLLRYNPHTRFLEPFPIALERTRPFFPSGIAVDASGRIIVANQDGHELLVFDRTGQLLRKIGGESSSLERPIDLAIDAADHLYVLDGVRREVQVWNLDGRLVRTLKVPAAAAKVSGRGATALAVGPDGTVYVTDGDAGQVIGFLPDGRVVSLEKPAGLEWHSPEGIAVDGAGQVYVTDYHHYAISEFSRKARFLDDHLLAKERLRQPTRMAVGQHSLYVVNEGKSEILQFAIRAATTGLDHAILGEEYLALREPALAAAELALAVQLGYAQAETHYFLGRAYSDLDQLPEATRHFQTAVAKDPRFVDAFVALGDTFFRRGDYPAAMAQYRTVLELRPQHHTARRSLAETALALHDLKRAGEQFAEVLRLAPDDVVAQVGLGRVYLVQQAYRRAEETLLNALRIDPKSREARFYLGLTYGQSGRYVEAIPLLEESTRRGPFFTAAFYHLGLSYAAVGEPQKAAQSFKRTLELQPHHAEALRELRKLQ